MTGKYHVLSSVFLASLALFLVISPGLEARDQQNAIPDSISLNECLNYALKNQPLIQQLKLDEKIVDQNIKISLSDWLPQIHANAGLQHYLKQPVSIFPNFSDPTGPKIEVTTGVINNSNMQFSASQNIFTNDLYFEGRTARYYRQEAGQTSEKGKIQLVVDVSKAFYDVLLSRQILKIIDEEIIRLTKNLKDALLLFKNGTTDRIDYSRATISLNNTRAQRIAALNSVNSKISTLKQLMGYPDNKSLALKYDFNLVKNEVLIDTLNAPDYRERIEYRLLRTDLLLKQLSISYYRQPFLPSLSGFINYNLIYQNDNFRSLYNKSFSNSVAGLALSFPLFEGTQRLQNLKKSRLEFERSQLDTLNLRNEVNTLYVQAMSSYKSNLAAYNITIENIKIASDVYNTVLEQYRQGVKSYLEVIISEADLQTSKVDNLSALISLMFSKIDVQQARGEISINY